MSFSARVKNEIARVTGERKCCQRAELSALLAVDTTREARGNGSQTVILSTENAAAARKAFTLLKRLTYLHTEVVVQKRVRLRKSNIYIVRIPPQPGLADLLEELGLGEVHAVWHFAPQAQCRGCQRAYLRGAFLAGGSVANPERGYHLEVVAPSGDIAQGMVQVMANFELQGRIVWRKARPVVYLKEAEQVVSFLNVIGAHGALLEFENVRVFKDVRNNINRLVNCETANLSKTVDASMRQVEKIKYLETVMGLERLPPGLREVARLRLELQEMSLKELGQNLSPPLGKSGVNHRLRRLEALADGLLGDGPKAKRQD